MMKIDAMRLSEYLSEIFVDSIFRLPDPRPVLFNLFCYGAP